MAIWGAIAKFGLQVAGSLLLSSLLAPNVRQTGSRLEDKSVQTSTYGATIMRIHGECAGTGNVFWLKGNQLFDISVTAKGKKTSLFGSRSRTTVFPVFATFAVGLCEGPIAGIRRLWIGSDLVYDAGSDDIEAIIASNQRVGADPLATLPDNIVFKGDVSSVQDQLPPWTFKIYYGTEDQEPSVAQEADKGVGNVPAYRGIAYIEIYNLPLEKYGNSLAGAQVKAEIIKSQTESVRLVASDSMNGNLTGFEPNTPYFDISDDGLAFVAEQANVTVAGVAKNEYYEASKLSNDLTLVNLSKVYNSGNGPYAEGFFLTAATVDGYAVARNDGVICVFYNGRFLFQPMPYPGATSVWSYGEGLYSPEFGGLAWFRGGYLYLGVRRTGGVGFSYNSIYKYSLTSGAVTSTKTPIAQISDVDSGFSTAPKFYMHIDRLGNLWTLGHHDALLKKYDADLNLISSVSYTPGTSDDFTRGFGISGDYLFEVYGSNLRMRNLSDFSLVKTVAMGMSSNYLTRVIAIGGVVYVQCGLNVKAWQVDYQTGDITYLSDIVSAEAQLSNYLSASDIDVTDLTDTVRGYRITDTGTIRSHIEPLQAVWPFDVYQSGYKLKFVRRGNAAVVSIPASKLDARPYGAAPGTELLIEREMDAQLPREVALKYLDAQREYDIGEQRAERKTTESINKIEVEIPVSLTATEAAQAVEVMLWMAWADRHDASFLLPPEYLNLEPTDVIEVTGQWGAYNFRLEPVDYKTDGRLECKAKFESAATYVSTAQGATGGEEQVLGLSGPTFYRLLDIPLLNATEDVPGMFVAMRGYTTGWPGAVLYRSTDGGAWWEDVISTTRGVTCGIAMNSIGAGRTNLVDSASALEVSFIGDAPSTVTYAEMLGYSNHFAYGVHGRWEIIGAQVVTDITGGKRLTNLLRGRYGTEWAMELHGAGDAVIELSDNDIEFLNIGTVGGTALYLGITSDKDLNSDTARSITYEGVALTPLSSVYAKGHIHPSTADWSCSFIPRGRIDIEWEDYVDVPVGEATEAYEIDILSYASGSVVVKRTIETSTPEFTYPSADQITDFGANQTEALYVAIYKMSATVGRGYPLYATIAGVPLYDYERFIRGEFPVRYYTMDDLATAVVKDSSVNGDNKSFTGTGYVRGETPLITEGFSTLFGAGDAYLHMGGTNPIATVVRSYEFWLKLSGTGEQRVYDWQDSIGYYMLRATNAATGAMQALFQVSTNRTIDFTISTSDVSHVVITHSAANKMIVYVNGVEVGSRTVAGTLTGSGTTRAIGRHRTSAANYWRGWMDHIALYDRELTAVEVLQHYNAGI